MWASEVKSAAAIFFIYRLLSTPEGIQIAFIAIRMETTSTFEINNIAVKLLRGRLEAAALR